MPTKLIDLSVKLDYFSKFPMPETEALATELEHRVFARALLRDLVWFHLYLFPVDYKTKQRACGLLNIKVMAGALFNPNVKVLE